MLRHLHIENYAIIESLDIELSPSLNTITGETGAGKSILLGALGLLSGARADSSAILSGADRCVVEGIFSIDGYGLEPLFKELDLDYQSEVAIRRVVQSTGKSRAFVADCPVTLPTLKAISDQLIDIHSQHQTLLLGRGEFQCKIVDAVAGSERLLENYQNSYFKLIKLREQIELKLKEQSEVAAQLDYITFQVEQLSEAAIKIGEQSELESQQSDLTHAEEVSISFASAAQLLGDENGGVLTTLKIAQSTIGRIIGKHSASEELESRLGSCYIELQDIAQELEDRASSIEADPRLLESINSRLDTIYSLCKKHKCSSGDELSEVLADFQSKLSAIESGDEDIEALRAEAEELQKEAFAKAIKLTKQRSLALPRIEKFVVQSLRSLGIKHPNFKVELRAKEELSQGGLDTIEFLFSANERSELQPIGAVASGGEMSRLMLSIKNLVAREMKLPTVIFDEIDTGVSGAVADAMGEIIEGMSSSMQVINITHLPQVAAKGNDHYEVYKDSGTHIRRLNPEERVERIAAMLSGATITDAARIQAEELLTTKR